MTEHIFDKVERILQEKPEIEKPLLEASRTGTTPEGHLVCCPYDTPEWALKKYLGITLAEWREVGEETIRRIKSGAYVVPDELRQILNSGYVRNPHPVSL